MGRGVVSASQVGRPAVLSLPAPGAQTLRSVLLRGLVRRLIQCEPPLVVEACVVFEVCLGILQLVPTCESLYSRVFSSLRRPIWGLMVGCESVVGENGYPLGRLSSVSKSMQRAGVCGPLAFVSHCWPSCAFGCSVDFAGASDSAHAFWLRFWSQDRRLEADWCCSGLDALARLSGDVLEWTFVLRLGLYAVFRVSFQVVGS